MEAFILWSLGSFLKCLKEHTDLRAGMAGHCD